jgi:uncharacterized protein
VSRMVYKARVIGFVDLSGLSDGSWDPTLMYVMCGGLVVSFLSYQWVEGHNAIPLTHHPLKHPMNCQSCEFSVPHNAAIDAQLISGGILFGIGWGIGGICPGPAIYLAGAGVAPVIAIWWPCFFLGSFISMKVKEYLVPIQAPTGSAQTTTAPLSTLHEEHSVTETLEHTDLEAGPKESEQNYGSVKQ